MNIALLGYGTVGSGAAECMAKMPMDNVRLRRVFGRRDIPAVSEILTKNIDDILCDDSIDIAAEVMGGDEPAYTYVKRALSAGKNVVSANKLMLSKHYDELIEIANEKGVTLAFSAAVGGGIPWLYNLLRTKRVDRLLSLGGVMNGTTNYILDAMQTSDEAEFSDVLKTAQQLGYAEADPTADIDGLDVKAKIALTCDIAFDKMINPDDVPALGIRYITRKDIAYFRTLRRNCRLIGRAEKIGEDIAVYVEPMLFKPTAPEYNLPGAGNMISYNCELLGGHTFVGQGAGKEPTGSAIVQDIYDIASDRSIFKSCRCTGAAAVKCDAAEHEYYVRTAAEIDGGIIKEKLAENTFITNKISVSKMHGIARDIIASGAEIFAAGFAD